MPRPPRKTWDYCRNSTREPHTMPRAELLVSINGTEPVRVRSMAVSGVVLTRLLGASIGDIRENMSGVLVLPHFAMRPNMNGAEAPEPQLVAMHWKKPAEGRSAVVAGLV